MARPPRFDVPGCPAHVTQRGVNRCAIFLDDHDRRHYLRLLRDGCRRWSVAVYAYVLMGDHVHLLLGTTAVGDLSRAMHAVGQNYVQSFNARHHRVGTLWQGRFKATVVDSDAYLLRAMRYIELNPVRAAIVAQADEYAWSSVHAHLASRGDPTITFHERYLSLGSRVGLRAAAWSAWLDEGIADEELAVIRRHIARESVLGDARFMEMVGRTLNRPVAPLPRGRPRLAADPD